MAKYKLTATDIVLRDDNPAGIPNDQNNGLRIEYEAWLAAGNVPDSYVPVIPSSVTPRQARLALLSVGLLDQVEAMVQAAGGTAKITWEFASVIERNNSLIAQIGSGLGMSDAQIDAMFIQAATL